MHKQLLTLAQFCEVYGVSRSTAYRLFNAGTLCPRKSGSRTVIVASEAEAWAGALPHAAIGGRFGAATRRRPPAAGSGRLT
jgi:predicted DNA-binding transcriptional regulator AlpA